MLCFCYENPYFFSYLYLYFGKRERCNNILCIYESITIERYIKVRKGEFVFILFKKKIKKIHNEMPTVFSFYTHFERRVIQKHEQVKNWLFSVVFHEKNVKLISLNPQQNANAYQIKNVHCGGISISIQLKRFSRTSYFL